MYFNCCGAIDVHNHYRQGSMGLEEHRTKTWWWRLAFTLVGMSVVDSFLAMSLTHRSCPSFSDFVVKLSNQLIFHRRAPRIHPSMSQQADEPPEEKEKLPLEEKLIQHHLQPLSQHPYYKSKLQARTSTKKVRYNKLCHICGTVCYYYCASADCTQDNQGSSHILAICGSPKSCLSSHLAKVVAE
jgi:hypothetical protein